MRSIGIGLTTIKHFSIQADILWKCKLSSEDSIDPLDLCAYDIGKGGTDSKMFGVLDFS